MLVAEKKDASPNSGALKKPARSDTNPSGDKFNGEFDEVAETAGDDKFGGCVGDVAKTAVAPAANIAVFQKVRYGRNLQFSFMKRKH